MKWVKDGATRYVLLTKKRAIKLPRPTTWRSFLSGLLANNQELVFSRAFSNRDDRLCPVQFWLPLGIVIVMPRAVPLTRLEFEARYRQIAELCRPGEYEVPAEMKPSSFGWLDGRIVAIDYG